MGTGGGGFEGGRGFLTIGDREREGLLESIRERELLLGDSSLGLCETSRRLAAVLPR